MPLDNPPIDNARAGHPDDKKIIDKFTGLCLNNSPLKHGEVMRLDKMDPTEFLRMEFKTFGQQSDFTHQAFNFCMKMNGEVNDQAMALSKQLMHPKKKKKTWHPNEQPGYGNGDDPEYFPEPLRHVKPRSMDWSRELDKFYTTLAPLDVFEAEMREDPNVSAENSITLNEEIGAVSSFMPDSMAPNDFGGENLILDDFGGNNLTPQEVERQFLELLPSDLRLNMTATFPENQQILENNFMAFDLEVPQFRISPQRATAAPRTTNFSIKSDENVSHLADQQQSRVTRLSKSPRQPFMSVNDTELLQPVTTQVPDQIPLMTDTLNEVQPHVVPNVDTILEVRATEEPPNEPPPQLLLPNLTDVSETEPVLRQRRVRNVPTTLVGHNVPKFGRFVKRRYHGLRLFDPNEDEDDDEMLDIPYEMGLSDTEKLFAAMHITEKVQNTDLLNHLAQKASNSASNPSIIIDKPTILRPSTCLIKEASTRRTSTIRDQVQNSPLPLMSTLDHILNEQQQHLDSAVINTQHVNINLTDLQRKINKTADETPEIPVIHIFETPTMRTIQQIQDEQFEIQHKPMLQSLVREQETRNKDQFKYTDNEKKLIKMFAKILTICGLMKRSEIGISDIISIPNQEDFVTLLKLSWETPRVIEIVKDARTCKAIRVKLIGYEAVFAD
ncbi:uncharacterized protein LOC134834455 isoform X1 [Culicoides brevitarsis]|uniref:uncharacterized protein LOC134834455 isoform X1 n=2 Tax=Culicoides brevitarsis TaxID=469753 RepID=UPI00307B6710